MPEKWIAALLGLVVSLLPLSGCADTTASGVASVSAPSARMEPAPEPAPVLESEPMPEPLPEAADSRWKTGSPESHGMDAQMLQNLHPALASTGIYSSVVIKDGVLVDEYYKEGYGKESVFALNSVTKSVTGALIGIAIDEGLIEGVDVSIAEYFPQVRGTGKQAITIRHLLDMTSGIQWYEWGGNAESFWGYRNSGNWVETILEQPMDAAPGEVFTYSTGNVHLLSAILQQVSGMSEEEYAQKRLFDPMGIESAEWATDPQGITDGGNGLSLTATDAAKLGQLFLDGGEWGGKQLIPKQWVEESTRQQSSGVAERSGGAYGYLFWMRPFGADRVDTYFAMGHAGQYILVTPELQLVTVFTSPHSQNTYVPWDYFSSYIVDACG